MTLSILTIRQLLLSNQHFQFGRTKKLQKKFTTNRIIFSPEFLREGSALYDNLYPSRIIVGNEHPKSHRNFINSLMLQKINLCNAC